MSDQLKDLLRMIWKDMKSDPYLYFCIMCSGFIAARIVLWFV